MRPSQAIAISSNVTLKATPNGVEVTRDWGNAVEHITTFSWAKIQRLLDYKNEAWP